MSADFNWWLVLVGVVVGAALTWLVVAESQRREREVGERELEAEAGWIARTVDTPGLDAERAELVLRAHRRYLKYPPPDTLVDPAALRELDPGHDVMATPGTQPVPGRPVTAVPTPGRPVTAVPTPGRPAPVAPVAPPETSPPDPQAVPAADDRRA